ncbi:MAG: riboflavin synthase, partial [Proteobacteria bacterium]|nr:riboflavin synthase [Pseudomonadota bacterium]
MFTGLVERTGRVIEISSQLTGHNLFKLTIDPGPDFARTQGASVAVNGVCLSEVEDNVEGLLHFHVSPETLSKTSLDQVRVGHLVNLERAMRPSDRFGGHIVLGHVDGTGRVVDLQKVEDFWLLKVEVSFDLSRYIVSKGSITIDGVSLTVNAIEDQPTSSIISFMLIPITWETTALHQAAIGFKVNVEVDILAKHLERFATRAKDQMSRLITPLALMFMIVFGFGVFSQNVYAIGWTDIRLALIKNNVS